jgi:hypothetical protein
MLGREVRAVTDADDAQGGIVAKCEGWKRHRRDDRLERAVWHVDDEALDHAVADELEMVGQRIEVPVRHEISAWI